MRRVVSTLALAWFAAAGMAAQRPSFDEVMRRAHAYVVDYEDHQLSGVLASELYQQQILEGDDVTAERTLRSDYLIFQLPPEEDWFALRDVYEVDGAPVPDRESVLQLLRNRPPDGITDLAMAIAERSARFNLGTVYRTVNLPTYPLRFLRPANRKRFDFDKQAEETTSAGTTWVVAYEEEGRPTFSVTLDGDDLPARGRFWIEPDTGAVVRTEMTLGGSRRVPDRVTITVTYALDATLGIRVPVEMRERYDRPRQKDAPVIVGVAAYSNFRPFDWRTLVRPSG